MANKITNKQKFERVLAQLTNAEDIEFIQHQIDMIDKKAENKSAKMTPAQQEGKIMRDAIVEFLLNLGEGMTITEMIADIPACNGKSNQCVTQHVSKLIEAGTVQRYEVKGKAYFKAVAND